jgi:UDP-N-acetylmuramyl pentapeptide phosphotransferase/UDP-N-acetylglucosamine-1-phosphate transferase
MSIESIHPLYNDWLKLGITFLCSFFITYFAIPVIVRVSVAKNLFVLPNGRTSHKYATPTLGGIAMFAGILVPSLLFVNPNEIFQFQFAIAGGCVIFFFGVKDDLTPLTWKIKLLGEILAAFFLITLGDFRITNMHGILGLHELSYAGSTILSFFAFMGVVNAINLIDGIDGLAAGITFLATTIFGVWFFLTGEMDFVYISIAIIGTLLAYLGFNVFGVSNKIFMGDTGSLLLGYLMTMFVVVFTQNNIVSNAPWHIHNAPVIAIAILFIPLFDTIRVMMIRIFKKKSPFSADRNHIHHRLLNLGLNHIQTTMVLIVTNGVLILIVFLLQNLEVHLLLLVIIAFGLLKSFVPAYLRKRILAKVPQIVMPYKNVSKEVANTVNQNGYKLKN